MTDWNVVASLATAAGTLTLAAATFASIRSANRSARVAEKALALRLQPVLVSTRPEDPPERATFMEGIALNAPGGAAALEARGDNLYLVLPVRNVGPGLAVLRAGHVAVGSTAADSLPADDTFRVLQRDIYVSPGEQSFWQIGVRDSDDPFRAPLEAALRERRDLTITVAYSDHFGGHPMRTRFRVSPAADGTWMSSVVRHWGMGP